MKIHYIIIISMGILSSIYGNSFEQNGVKEGNVKLSATLYSDQSDDKSDTVGLTTQLGYFMNDRVELLFGLRLDSQRDEIYFTLAPGVSYYFYKSPRVTSYLGAKVYYWNTTNRYIEDESGSTLYLGTDLFISEDVALTPEIGVHYLDFKTKKGTYFNTFLTYFF